MIQLAIPALAVIVGLLLYRKRPTIYVAYCIWVWVLTPLLRRLIDLELGYQNQSVILISPHLVTAISAFSLFASRRKNPTPLPLSLLLCIVGVLYGFLIGIFVNPSAELVVGLLNWLTPLLFGAHLALDWRHYEENRSAILRCMIWVVGVMGVYGVFQYFVAPVWDTYWLEHISPGLMDPSFGQPEPMQIRVWSTLNSPGVFSFVMAAALVFSTTATPSVLTIPFTIAGYIAFLLCQVRAAWLGWLLGLVLALRRSRPKVLFRTVGGIALVAACVVPIVIASPDIAPMVTERLASLTNVQEDYSFRERQEVYQVVVGTILHLPFGHGLRSLESVGNLPVDSGMLSTLLSMGWLGTFFYLGGVILALVRPRGSYSDNVQNTCRAVCFANLAQFFAGNVFVNVGGTVFWMCAGLSIAGFKWNQLQHASEAAAPILPKSSRVLESAEIPVAS